MPQSSQQSESRVETKTAVEAAQDPEQPPGLPHLVELAEADLIWYEAGPNVGPHGFQSYLGILGKTDHDVFHQAAIIFICDSDIDGGLEAVVLIHRANAGEWEYLRLTDVGSTRATADFGPESSRRSFDSVVRNDSAGLVFRDGGGLLKAAKQQHLMNVRAPLPEGDPEAKDYVVATFDLRGVFDTPVQPNLDYCGDY